jgi:hypothetical protein
MDGRLVMLSFAKHSVRRSLNLFVPSSPYPCVNYSSLYRGENRHTHWVSHVSCNSAHRKCYSSARNHAFNQAIGPSGQLRPLEGVTVVSLEQAIAAPYCTRHLADLGARVIKVERPGVGDFARDYDERVDGLASHFVWTNRSKESLALDLKNAEDLVILKKLLGRADVLVQNLAPGATRRLGLSYDALQ